MSFLIVILQLMINTRLEFTALCLFVFFNLQQLAPHVRVWDSVSLNTLHVLGSGFFDRSLVCLAFSKSVRKGPRNETFCVNTCEHGCV